MMEGRLQSPESSVGSRLITSGDAPPPPPTVMGYPTPVDRSRTWLNVSVVCGSMSAALYVLSRTVADVDLWGHVKFGDDTWLAGRIIQQDSYSYTAGDQLWINHEWLAEVIFGRLFAAFGPPGLVTFKTAISLMIVGLIYQHLCRRGLSPAKAGVFIILVTLLLVQGLGAVRPQLFTYLFFLVLLLCIDAAERGQFGWLWVVPALFAAWVNLHGGFLAGLAILFAWSTLHLASWYAGAPMIGVLVSRRTLTILTVLLASTLATLANPFGTTLLAFLLRPETLARPEITEWQPIRILSLSGVMYLTFLAIAATGLVGSRRPRRLALMGLCVCMALLPLLAVRHGSLFVLGTAVLAGEHVGSVWNRWWRSARAPMPAAWRIRLWAGAISILLASVLIRASAPHFQCIEIVPFVTRVPARAVALLRESGVRGNLAVYFDWGEYALWHVSPRIKVSVDGRRETVYPDEIYTMNVNFWTGLGDWDALLRYHDTHLALVNKELPSSNLMKLKPGWRLIYEDSTASLFARADYALVDQIQRTPPRDLPHDGKGLCFPG